MWSMTSSMRSASRQTLLGRRVTNVESTRETSRATLLAARSTSAARRRRSRAGPRAPRPAGRQTGWRRLRGSARQRAARRRSGRRAALAGTAWRRRRTDRRRHDGRHCCSSGDMSRWLRLQAQVGARHQRSAGGGAQAARRGGDLLDATPRQLAHLRLLGDVRTGQVGDTDLVDDDAPAERSAPSSSLASRRRRASSGLYDAVAPVHQVDRPRP